jgi:hypothetical protein
MIKFVGETEETCPPIGGSVRNCNATFDDVFCLPFLPPPPITKTKKGWTGLHRNLRKAALW